MKTSWKSLFSKPITVKKCLVLLLLLALVVAVALGVRLVYVMLNPSAAFAGPVEEPVVVDNDPLPVQAGPQVEDEGAPVGTPLPTPDPEQVLLSTADLEFMKDRVNILLVGADENLDRDQTTRTDFRSDVLILLTVDFANKKVDMISVPRDSYVAQYNVVGRFKVNACFAHGGGFQKDGFLYARETVSMIFGGIPIPYHIGVNMDGVKHVVDAIGGVDYDVDVEIRLNGRVLEKGPQHLNGQQVLDYCRARKGISTDVGRADRQQRILFAIFNQLKREGRLTQVPQIYSAIKDDIFTNMNLEQIAALAVLGLQMDHERDLNRHTLEGEYMTNVYNFSFYALYQQKKCDLVNRVFGISIKPDMTYDATFIKADWACIQGDLAIETAQAAIIGAPSWATTQVQAQMNALSESVSALREGVGDLAEVTAGTTALLQEVQLLKDTLAAQENGMPLQPTPLQPTATAQQQPTPTPASNTPLDPGFVETPGNLIPGQ